MVSSLFLCRKLHPFLGKSTKTAATRPALFDSNMHQIVCQLRLRTRPHWGSLQLSPYPLVVFRRPTSKARRGEEKGREWKGREGEGRKREGRVEEGRGGMEFILCPKKKKKSLHL